MHSVTPCPVHVLIILHIRVKVVTCETSYTTLEFLNDQFHLLLVAFCHSLWATLPRYASWPGQFQTTWLLTHCFPSFWLIYIFLSILSNMLRIIENCRHFIVKFQLEIYILFLLDSSDNQKRWHNIVVSTSQISGHQVSCKTFLPSLMLQKAEHPFVLEVCTNLKIKNSINCKIVLWIQTLTNRLCYCTTITYHLKSQCSGIKQTISCIRTQNLDALFGTNRWIWRTQLISSCHSNSQRSSSIKNLKKLWTSLALNLVVQCWLSWIFLQQHKHRVGLRRSFLSTLSWWKCVVGYS